MTKHLRTVAIFLASSFVVGFLWVGLRTPFQRLIQPSVVRSVTVANQSTEAFSLLAVRLDTNTVMHRAILEPGRESTFQIFLGDDSVDFDRAEFALVAWSASGPSQSKVMKGHELRAAGDRVVFGDPAVTHQPGAP